MVALSAGQNMNMSAGELRHRVTIQWPTKAADEAGGFSTTWADLATVWAAIEPLSGRERFHAQSQNMSVSHRVRMRFLAGVTAEHRVIFGGRFFNVRSVINQGERNRWLILDCEEGVPI